MKKAIRMSLAALLFTFLITALTGFGEGRASAGTLPEDLDGDGNDETVVWELSEDGETLESLTINGKDVYAATKVKEPFTGFYIDVFTFDTNTKDSFKEVVVRLGIEELVEYYIYRYDKGSISKYAVIEEGSLLEQKTKNRIKVRTYRSVRGLGNFYVTAEYKVKSGKATLVTKTYKPDKTNEKVSFKSTKKLTLYTDTDYTEEAGILKKNEKFTLVKFEPGEEGFCSNVYVKTKSGVKGWINTESFGYSTFFIKNPPVWE